MRDVRDQYPGQFEQSPDLLFVAISREEIVHAMSNQGDEEALNDVCLSVAIVADCIDSAMELART
ncbi:MAG: hypothetical protein KUG75_15750 [Pseudomonadales bacterium]|nr:hypothetical protein [Pseudomonadales bacterium]